MATPRDVGYSPLRTPGAAAWAAEARGRITVHVETVASFVGCRPAAAAREEGGDGGSAQACPSKLASVVDKPAA